MTGQELIEFIFDEYSVEPDYPFRIPCRILPFLMESEYNRRKEQKMPELTFLINLSVFPTG